MKNRRLEKHKANLEIANILFENGMDFSIIEKITDIKPIELLAAKIKEPEDGLKDTRKKQK